MDNVIIRKGGIESIFDLLNAHSAKKILLVTGKKSFDLLNCQNIFQKLFNDFDCCRYSEFETNPKFEDLSRGSLIVHKFQPDIIIGIGGGSVMDTAKMLSILPSDEESIRKIITGQVGVSNRKASLILIPTTAGSGSEATHFAVAYIGKTKYSIASKFLLPDNVILDYSLTESMDKSLIAVTAFDAFSQALESYWAVGSTEQSRSFAQECLLVINDIIEELLLSPKEKEREKMLRASFLAGQAINISKTTAPHAMSYGLSMEYGIPHGLAVFLTLGAFVEHNFNAPKNLFASDFLYKESQKRFEEILRIFKLKDASSLRKRISTLLEKANLPTNLREIGFSSDEEIYRLCEEVNVERLSNNPVKLTTAELQNILKSII